MLLIFVYSPMTLKVGQGHNHFSGTPLLWQGYVQSPPMIGIHYSALCELSTVFPGKSGPHFQRKKSPNGTVKYTPHPSSSPACAGYSAVTMGLVTTGQVIITWIHMAFHVHAQKTG